MLEVSNLSLLYGKHLALDDVSIAVGQSEAVAILGANGAGKTSLLKSIIGLVTPHSAAEITFDGQSIAGREDFRMVEFGLALVPEGRGLFPELTVDENIRLGANPRRARASEARNRSLVFDLFPKLAERRKQTVGTMSGGEQQMVAVARALMSMPRLLMLDEPSLGLAPVIARELFASLDEIRKSGVAMLIVEQNVKASLSICARGYLMEAGKIVGEDSAERLKSSPMVQRAFLGPSE